MRKGKYHIYNCFVCNKHYIWKKNKYVETNQKVSDFGLFLCRNCQKKIKNGEIEKMVIKEKRK